MEHKPPPTQGLSRAGLTALWVLHHRSVYLRDPVAERVLRGVEDMKESLGPAMGGRTATMTHYFTQRAALFDAEIRRFMSCHPDPLVVALGEGLETQFWRVDDERLRWISVDLPDVIRLRQAVMPFSERITHVACSVLDTRWMSQARCDRPLLITAQGLFMYLRPRQVTELLRTCAQRCPGSTLVFDTSPWWFVGLSRIGGLHCGQFRIPPMLSSLSPAGLARLRSRLPAGTSVTHVPAQESRGLFRTFHRHGHRVPLVSGCLPATVRVDFPEG